MWHYQIYPLSQRGAHLTNISMLLTMLVSTLIVTAQADLEASQQSSAQPACFEKCCYHQPTPPSLRMQVPQNCKLLVVAAGFPRSGSTWTFELAQEVLFAMGFDVYSDYWRYNEHVPMTEAEARVSVGAFNNENSRPHDVYVLKSHEYDPELLKACNSNVVVLMIYRHLFDIAASMHDLGWELMAGIENNIACSDLWTSVANLNIKYEVAKRQRQVYAALIAAEVAIHMNMTLNGDELLGVMRMPQQQAHAPTGNHTKYGLSMEERQQLATTYCDWLKEHGYDCGVNGQHSGAAHNHAHALPVSGMSDSSNGLANDGRLANPNGSA